MRYSAEHKLESRQRVLAAAARAIREQGPDRISVAGVMAEAGLTHGGFYAHFESKDALIAASFEYMFEETTTRLEKIMRDKPPREALLAYVEHYLALRHCDSRGSGCPFVALASDVPRLAESARVAFSTGLLRRQQRLAHLFAEMGVDDPDVSARSVQAELLGTLSIARLLDGRERQAMLEATKSDLRQRFGLPDAEPQRA